MCSEEELATFKEIMREVYHDNFTTDKDVLGSPLFHTPDGDVILAKFKVEPKLDHFYIEWQGNFKTIKTSLFNDEPIKAHSDYGRIIMEASSRSDAIRYLKMAHEFEL